MEISGINICKWPVKSPNINIVEDIWKMISYMVCDINDLTQNVENFISVT